MGIIKYNVGSILIYKSKKIKIFRIVSTDTVSIEELDTNICHTVNISDLEPIYSSNISPFINLSKSKIDDAKTKMEACIKVLDGLAVKDVAKLYGKDPSTIYRWLERFDRDPTLSGLSSKKDGGKGRGRLCIQREEIIRLGIEKYFLNKSRGTKLRTVRKIRQACFKANLKLPSAGTIYKRIDNLPQHQVTEKRFGKYTADRSFGPIGYMDEPNFPLELVEMDHKTLNIALVDDSDRKPTRRPYLTAAIDVYSRMIIGFYLTYDPPSELSAGICLANSILTKENWLQKFDINEEWKCWGKMQTLVVDNAKEFRGSLLKNISLNYGINIEHRPVKNPHKGGSHIESWFRTLKESMRDLPGYTFTNVVEKGDSNPEKDAVMTIDEFEKWLLIFITKLYHRREHTQIKTSPVEKFQSCIIEQSQIISRFDNEHRVRMDFLPFVMRTIQEYGVIINHIKYYSDVLRKYIHSRKDNHAKSEAKKFIFRKDPRFLNVIYFYDEELNDYFEVQTVVPRKPFTHWQHQEALAILNSRSKLVTEEALFEIHDELDKVVENSKNITKGKKRKSKLQYGKIKNFSVKTETKPTIDVNISSDYYNITPFQDIDYGTFK